MNVSDMLNLMATLGVGESTSVESPNDIFLQYLNLANSELYTATANFNSDVLVNETLQNAVDESSVVLAQTPHLISSIFPIGLSIPLIEQSLSNFNNYKFLYPNSFANPLIYTRQKNVVSFYPFQPGVIYTLDIWYVPPVADLTEDTMEDDIPYPASYQQILVDGALYYLFNDESGFRSAKKEDEAKNRWEKGKKRLISYLQGVNSETISTFCNV